MSALAHLPALAESLPNEYYLVSSASKIAGIVSLSVWLFAQLPQVLENYLNHSVHGVSTAFLACWVSGDVTNLIGCLLTRALPFQTCLAAYYCFIDFILCLQYWYYTSVYPRQAVHHNMLQSPNMMRPVVSNEGAKSRLSARLNRFEASPALVPLTGVRSSSALRRRPRKVRRSFLQKVLSSSVISGSFKKASAMPVDADFFLEPLPGHSLSWMSVLRDAAYSTAAFFSGWHYSPALVGTVSGWFSTCLYVSSRTPQIRANYRNKSTHGISPFMFLFAMTGNIFYAVSIACDLYLLSKYEVHLGNVDFQTVFYAQLPFLVGSSGTVAFDAIILCQFWWYQSNSKDSPKKAKKPVKKVSRSTSGVHFKKPDWYTNHFGENEADEWDTFPDDEPNYGATAGSVDKYYPYKRAQVGFDRDESSLLLRESTFIVSPPLHYIVSTPQTNDPPIKHRRGISDTFTAIAKSFSNSSMLVRSPSITSSHSGRASPGPTTALIPSLVGTYSLYSKKMMNDSKVPFSPIDFLHNDFLHHSGSLSRETHPQS